MSEFDVYLNAKGYSLAKGIDGQLQGNAVSEQVTNPFARYLQADRQYQIVPFMVSDGCGAAKHDGSYRYQHADYIDTRSGEAIVAPFARYVWGGYTVLHFPTSTNPPYDVEVSTGGTIGVAESFVPGTGLTAIRAVHIMVRRTEGYVYDSASDFTVKLYDNSGGKPGTMLSGASVTKKLKYDEELWLPFPDRWKDGQYFWLECIFAADVSVTPGTTYWLAVENNQAADLFWAEYRPSESSTRSVYYSGAWQTGASDYPLAFWFDDASLGTDTLARCMRLFGGSDGIQRLYVGTGYKVMAVNKGGTWTMTESKELPGPILDMLEFDEKLFVCQGPSNDMWYTTGASATTVWTQVTGVKGTCLALHDNMIWKGDAGEVKGDTTGTGWAGNAVKVGDPGSPVQALVSHGGKLFAAKPEGIFEISYPDAYPTSGTPTANLMLDFRTELAPRTWMLDWHSGLYFPGLGGIYELKGGILRNIWTDKIDEGALELSPQWSRYAKRRSWSPIYDAEPGCFTAAWTTSRGLYAIYSSKAPNVTRLYYYDNRSWHDLGPPETMQSLSSYYVLGYTAVAGISQDIGGGRGYLVVGLPARLAYWRWPTWTNDRAQDSWADYITDAGLAANCSVVFPVLAAEQRSEQLLFAKVGVSGIRKAAGNTIAIYYKIDNASSWTSLGAVAVPTAGGYAEIDFPAGTTGSQIQLKLSLGVGVGITVSPRVSQVDLLYQTASTPYTTHQLIIHAAAEQERRSGGPDSRTANEILAELRALAASAGFTYIDPTGGSHTVRITGMRVTYARQELQPGATLPTEAFCVLSLLEL